MVEVQTPNKPVNTPAGVPAKPLPTDIKELYSEFEKTCSTAQNKGQKANKIRDYIKDIQTKVGKSRLSLSAIHAVIKNKYPDDKCDRSYLNNIVNSTWETEKDESGTVWILMDKPKAPKKV